MTSISSLHHAWRIAVAVGSCAVAPLAAHALDETPRMEAEIAELNVALNGVVTENVNLRASLAAAETSLANMRASLANSGGETEIFKRQSSELKLRMEALGVDSASGSIAKLEQRLLAAVASLQVSAGEKKTLTQALIRLSDSAALFARTSHTEDAQSRLALESEIRNAGAILSGNNNLAAAEEPSLVSGKAVSVKGELALVVMNLGSKHGIRVGMPFRVLRGEKTIGSVTVVDVRDKISGAVIQQLTSEQDPVKIGDSLKIAVQ